ncbi:MAG TPA: hypothetical protein VM422_13040, partial [Amaricoccus sp.]|nr:hypothetical protein [Amaricoccus sp.]
MTTYLWLYDAAGKTDQWPMYTSSDFRLLTATRSVVSYTGTIAAGDFVGSSVLETYHGRFDLSGEQPSGRVGSAEIEIDGQPTFGARYDDPLRFRFYAADFAERMDSDLSFSGNRWANRIVTGAGDDTLAGGRGNDLL